MVTSTIFLNTLKLRQILNFVTDVFSWLDVARSLCRIDADPKYCFCMDDFQCLETELLRDAQDRKITGWEKVAIILVA